MRLNGIAPGDVVRVNRLGRVFLAEVTGTIPGGLQIVPPTSASATASAARARCSTTSASAAARAMSDEALEPSPRQIELGI